MTWSPRPRGFLFHASCHFCAYCLRCMLTTLDYLFIDSAVAAYVAERLPTFWSERRGQPHDKRVTFRRQAHNGSQKPFRWHKTKTLCWHCSRRALEGHTSVLICQLYLLLTHGVSVNTTMVTSRYFGHPCSRSVFTLLWHAPVNTTHKTGHAYQPLPTIDLYQTSDYSETLRDWKHMLKAGITVTQHVFEEPFWRYLQLTFCCTNLWHMKETIYIGIYSVPISSLFESIWSSVLWTCYYILLVLVLLFAWWVTTLSTLVTTDS